MKSKSSKHEFASILVQQRHQQALDKNERFLYSRSRMDKPPPPSTRRFARTSAAARKRRAFAGRKNRRNRRFLSMTVCIMFAGSGRTGRRDVRRSSGPRLAACAAPDAPRAGARLAPPLDAHRPLRAATRRPPPCAPRAAARRPSLDAPRAVARRPLRAERAGSRRVSTENHARLAAALPGGSRAAPPIRGDAGGSGGADAERAAIRRPPGRFSVETRRSSGVFPSGRIRRRELPAGSGLAQARAHLISSRAPPGRALRRALPSLRAGPPKRWRGLARRAGPAYADPGLAERGEPGATERAEGGGTGKRRGEEGRRAQSGDAREGLAGGTRMRGPHRAQRAARPRHDPSRARSTRKGDRRRKRGAPAARSGANPRPAHSAR